MDRDAVRRLDRSLRDATIFKRATTESVLGQSQDFNSSRETAGILGFLEE